MQKKKIKRYKVQIIDDIIPVDRISITNMPAIEVKGTFFNKETKKIHFEYDEIQGILIAPTMIPNLEIPRYDEENDEYYTIVFEADIIKKIVEEFHKNFDGRKLNFDHTDQMVEATIIESWIKDFPEDKSNYYGFKDLPIGTHFVKIKFDDLNWFRKNIIEKEYSGLSIELYSGMVEFSKFKNNFYLLKNNIIIEDDNILYKVISEDFESFTDYPQAAVDNAARAIRQNEARNNKCATQVGKVRATQISQRKPLSLNTIQRTYAYLSRAEAYNTGDWDDCGTISYNLWGGDEMKRYCERIINEFVLKNIDNKKVKKYPLSKVEELEFLISEIEFEELETIISDFIVEPKENETQTEFIKRCIKKEVQLGIEVDQAIAMCISKWERK